VPTDYNVKKWKIDTGFQPASFPKKREPNLLSFGSVGSVTDHRSHTRVKLERDFDINSSYRRDIGLYHQNPREKFADTSKQVTDVSSTKELFFGTAKSTVYAPSYMGHVPLDKTNRAKLLESKNDVTKSNSKNHMVYSVEHNLPGYAGYKPHSFHNDKGPVYPGTDSTTHMSYTHHQNSAIPDGEKLHNKRGMILKNFFTEPKTSSVISADGCADAQTFFKKYRPYEALLKTGPAESRKWISDVDVKRSFIYTSTV
jgi:hypothetical protein